MKHLLILSGLEANGFAGLIRDLQVANSLGVTASAIATTLTAQTQDQLITAKPVDAAIVSQQLASLTLEIGVIKVGLLPNVAIAQQIAQWLERQSPTPILILDPVQTSSSNGESFSDEKLDDILEPLLPFITLMTPNLPELAALTSTTSHVSEAALVRQFYIENKRFQGSILVTGGHAGSTKIREVTDTLYQVLNDQVVSVCHWQQEKIDKQLRGTGCFLSTSIASAICDSNSLTDAITLSSAKLHEAFLAQPEEPKKVVTIQTNWPKQISTFPLVYPAHSDIREPNQPFPTMEENSGLYPVVPSSDWIHRLAKLGIKTIQLRIKSNDESTLRSEIKTSVTIAEQYNLQLFINDHWQLAVQYNAYGVHLGQEDIQTANLAKIHRAGLRLGISTHGDTEFKYAHQFSPSYLAVGAVYPTKTKDMTGKIQGLERLERYCGLSRSIPVVAIGGINEANINDVTATGADFVAVVSAITKADNPEEATLSLMNQMPGLAKYGYEAKPRLQRNS
jgi:hydroxymethylpyrimidine kinase/phosphomethylpyrimidine kinase/thiamine-phosphate diphosphorylase